VIRGTLNRHAIQFVQKKESEQFIRSTPLRTGLSYERASTNRTHHKEGVNVSLKTIRPFPVSVFLIFIHPRYVLTLVRRHKWHEPKCYY